MKHLYLVILFLSFSWVGAQEVADKGDIEGFSIYPNPVTDGKVFIQTAKNLSKEVHIFDVLGTMVMRDNIFNQELNVSRLDKGVYILRVIENGRVATRKLVIK